MHISTEPWTDWEMIGITFLGWMYYNLRVLGILQERGREGPGTVINQWRAILDSKRQMSIISAYLPKTSWQWNKVVSKLLKKYIETMYPVRRCDKDEIINMTRVWDNEKIWVPDQNQTHDFPNTGWALYPLSNKDIWSARRFYWVHVWHASCTQKGINQKIAWNPSLFSLWPAYIKGLDLRVDLASCIKFILTASLPPSHSGYLIPDNKYIHCV